MISGSDEERRSLQNGALAFLQKPVSAEDVQSALNRISAFVERRIKQLLVVEDDTCRARRSTT